MTVLCCRRQRQWVGNGGRRDVHGSGCWKQSSSGSCTVPLKYQLYHGTTLVHVSPLQHTVFACQRTHQLYCCCWWLLLLLVLLCLQVFQVRARASGKVFAMKVMRKERILQKDHGDYVRAERDLLTAVVHPYIVTLRYSFQSASKLYLVLDFINGGHLFFNLYRQVCGGSIVCCSWGSVGKGRAC